MDLRYLVAKKYISFINNYINILNIGLLWYKPKTILTAFIIAAAADVFNDNISDVEMVFRITVMFV